MQGVSGQRSGRNEHQCILREQERRQVFCFPSTAVYLRQPDLDPMRERYCAHEEYRELT